MYEEGRGKGSKTVTERATRKIVTPNFTLPKPGKASCKQAVVPRRNAQTSKSLEVSWYVRVTAPRGSPWSHTSAQKGSRAVD